MQDTSFRESVGVVILALGAFIAFGIVFFIAPKRGDVVVINCSIAEISPDFTIKMREACREASLKEFQKNLQKPK
jgi:hypothetical protein